MELREIDFFTKLSDNEIDIIKKHSLVVNYKEGDIVYYESDKPEYIFVLLEGSVDIYKTNSKGKQFYLHRVDAIDLLGEVAAFSDVLYPVTAECATKCKILKIDYNKTGKFFCNNPHFCKELVRSLYNRVLSLVYSVENSFIKTKERVAKYILKERINFRDKTYTEISKKLNMTPETFSRVLNEFKKRGFIKIDDAHQIEIVEKERLENIGDIDNVS